MQVLRTIAHQLFALFFADARFTLALVSWIVAASAIPMLFPQGSVLGALLFFSGFAGILVENLLHASAAPMLRTTGSPGPVSGR